MSEGMSCCTLRVPCADAGYAAYTAPGPAGPFALQRAVTNVSTNNATWHCGDFHLFVDDDGTPYIISACVGAAAD